MEKGDKRFEESGILEKTDEIIESMIKFKEDSEQFLDDALRVEELQEEVDKLIQEASNSVIAKIKEKTNEPENEVLKTVDNEFIETEKINGNHVSEIIEEKPGFSENIAQVDEPALRLDESENKRGNFQEIADLQTTNNSQLQQIEDEIMSEIIKSNSEENDNTEELLVEKTKEVGETFELNDKKEAENVKDEIIKTSNDEVEASLGDTEVKPEVSEKLLTRTISEIIEAVKDVESPILKTEYKLKDEAEPSQEIKGVQATEDERIIRQVSEKSLESTISDTIEPVKDEESLIIKTEQDETEPEKEIKEKLQITEAGSINVAEKSVESRVLDKFEAVESLIAKTEKNEAKPEEGIKEEVHTTEDENIKFEASQISLEPSISDTNKVVEGEKSPKAKTEEVKTIQTREGEETKPKVTEKTPEDTTEASNDIDSQTLQTVAEQAEEKIKEKHKTENENAESSLKPNEKVETQEDNNGTEEPIKIVEIAPDDVELLSDEEVVDEIEEVTYESSEEELSEDEVEHISTDSSHNGRLNGGRSDEEAEKFISSHIEADDDFSDVNFSYYFYDIFI